MQSNSMKVIGNEFASSRLRCAAQAVLIGIASWLSSIFFWAPSLTFYISQGAIGARRADVAMQCFDVFRRDLSEPILYYRLLQPLIASFFRFCSADLGSIKALLASPGLSFVASILSLSIVFLLTKRHLGGIWLPIVVTFLLASTQFVQWSNNIWGASDSFSLASIAALCLFRSPLLIPLFIFIGSVADERTLISIPLVLAFRFFQGDEFDGSVFAACTCRSRLLTISSNRLQYIDFVKKIYPWMLGIAFVSVFRLFIKTGIVGPGIEVSPYGSDLSLFSGYSRLFSFNGWMDLAWMYLQGFRWAWLIVIAYFFELLKQSKFREMIVGIMALACVLVPATIIADVARSTSYAFPLLLISIFRLKHLSQFSLVNMNRFLLIILALNYATPAGYSFGGPSSEFFFYYPMPIRIWRWMIFPGGFNAFNWRLG